MASPEQLAKLRRVINENLRIQRSGATTIPYIDVANALTDIVARQNYVVFGRRGCGKTLLLHRSKEKTDPSIRCIYLNCEDFKKHSFPNVLIQILDAVFAELNRNLTGWFGRKKESRNLIGRIRAELKVRQDEADKDQADVRESRRSRSSESARVNAEVGVPDLKLGGSLDAEESHGTEVERRYTQRHDKIRDLDMWLPKLKEHIGEFMEASAKVKGLYLQIDDFYHLNRDDQPFVMDYVHRVCKDLPLYFKVATLRHASILYADRAGQPIGAQERHDYQPINIDFTLADLRKTEDQNKKILHEFGRLAGMSSEEIDDLFKGSGFQRLVLAGGGVPRDCLSLFLEVLDGVQSGDGRIGKDDVRILSRSNFERRIEELKQDSEGRDQDALIRGIYVLRRFCIDKATNVFLVSDQMMQQEDALRSLVYRLLDYRIIHNAGAALTHKSATGTYQAFVIDIGCYAQMRKLRGRFTEVNLARVDAKERMRSSPILGVDAFRSLWKLVPKDGDPEHVLMQEFADGAE